jgi:hypothetical protein
VARGGLIAPEIKDLSGSLFLTLGQAQELLGNVRARGGRPWLYVAFCLAAYRANAIGTIPTVIAQAVIRIGRKRSPASAAAASDDE